MTHSSIKILQVIDSLKIGGAEVLMRNLAPRLIEMGYQVEVCYSTPGAIENDLRVKHIPLHRLYRFAKVDPFLLMGLIKVIRQTRPAVVHTHLFKSDLHGRIAARLCGVPVIVSTLHLADPWSKNPLLGWLYGYSAKFADKLIAVSEEVRSYQIQHTFVPPSKIITINNGVNVARFIGQETARETVRAELGIVGEAPLIGIVGRLVEQKDHRNFLMALASVVKKIPNLQAIIVGDGPLRNELQLLVEQLGLSALVKFCGLRNDIPAIMAAIDVLVFSSRWEGLPVALLEGMASARPVVATRVDGIQSVLEEGVTGLGVNPSDPTALAQGLEEVLQDPERAKKMGQAGRERIIARYSESAMIIQITQLYEELLHQKLMHTAK